MFINLITRANEDVRRFSPLVYETCFTCRCGWSGTETDLDVLTYIDTNLVCGPVCKNDDVK